jgi:hypothetical protein
LSVLEKATNDMFLGLFVGILLSSKRRVFFDICCSDPPVKFIDQELKWTLNEDEKKIFPICIFPDFPLSVLFTFAVTVKGASFEGLLTGKVTSYP